MGPVIEGEVTSRGYCGQQSSLQHWHLDAVPFSRGDGLRVARVGVTHHAQSGIAGQHALQARRRRGGAIRHDDLPGVLGFLIGLTSPTTKSNSLQPCYNFKAGGASNSAILKTN